MQYEQLLERRILILESDRDVRDVAAEVLEAVGANPHPVPDLDDGIHALCATAFDALLVEIVLWHARNALLPELARRLQQAAAVVLTGDSEHIPAPRDAYHLPKPFSREQLLKTLAAAIEARTPKDASP